MKMPPAFQFYASDYLSSSKVQRMTLEAEGAFIRLLAYEWMDGFIPADVDQLSRLCKCSVRKMASLWEDYLRCCFEPAASDPDKLINSRLEDVRRKQLDHIKERSEAGSKGAAKRWREHGSGNGKANGSAIKQPLAKNSSSVSIKETEESGDSSAVAKVAQPRQPDPAYDRFVERYQAKYGVPYRPVKDQRTGDFTQLVALRRDLGLEPRAPIPDWDTAVENYLATPQKSHTLADLSVNYASFRLARLDRYERPVEKARAATHNPTGVCL